MSGRVALEMQSRSLWQLMASYGIGSWIVLQVADTLSSLVGLPLWFGRALLAALLAGLLLLLATRLVQSRAAAGSALGAARLLTWSNAGRGALALAIVMALVTGGYMVLRVTGVGPLGTLQARGVFEQQERLILADFESNVEQAGLAETVTTLLRIDLAQSPAVTVLEPVQLAPVLARMQRDPEAPVTYDVALEAARREGIKAVVSGDLLQAGPSVVVSARIVAAASGDVLAAVRETARDVAELPDAVDRASAQLRERVGESLRSIQGDPPLEQVTTASFQALEKYAQANRANDRGDVQRSISLLEEAIAQDSTFAMAHRKLGVVLVNTGGDADRRTRAFTRAYELRSRLTDRERWLAEATYLQYVEGDDRGSMDRYVTLLESYPTDRVALNNLANHYLSLGRDAEAASLLLRSIRAGGAPATTYESAVTVLFGQGDTVGARVALEGFEQTHPMNPTTAQRRAHLRAARYDYEGAAAAAERLLEQARGTPGGAGAQVMLAQIRLIQGRGEDALRNFREGLTSLEELGIDPGISRGAAEAFLAGLLLSAYEERPEEALAAMDRILAERRVAEDPVERRQDLMLAVMYATLGDVERARALMQAYARTTTVPDHERFVDWLRASGTVGVAEGRVEEGIAELHAAREAVPACGVCLFAELGLAFDRAALPDSAIHYLDRYLTTPDLNRLQSTDDFHFWRSVPRLGALLVERGDTARAREVLTLFLDVTVGADAAYQGKRDRLRALLPGLTP